MLGLGVDGKTALANVTTTPTDMLSNAASSGLVLKIESLMISNVDGVSSADISASVYRGSTEYFIGYTVAVPADSTLVLISKDNTIYLEEGDSIRVTASADNYLQAICAYEEMSA